MSDKIKDGGPAFPTSEQQGDNPEFITIGGMSLRDYFAAKAMQGMISAHNQNGEWTGCGDIKMNEILSETAYSIADAMLKAREEK